MKQTAKLSGGQGGIDRRAALQGITGRPHDPYQLTRKTDQQLTSELGCDTIEGVREVPIGTLVPGRQFQLVLSATTPPPYQRQRGYLVRKGPGSVAVVLLGSERERSFTTQEGQLVTLHTAGGIAYWSPGTPVLPESDAKGRPVMRDISRWTTKGGTGVGEDPHHPANFQVQGPGGKINAQSAPGEQDMTRVAQLPGVGKAKAKAAKGKTKAKANHSAPKELHPCLCGCGERVAGRFRQGHDGRYYSILKQVSRGDMQFAEMPRAMQAALVSVAGVKKALAASGH